MMGYDNRLVLSTTHRLYQKQNSPALNLSPQFHALYTTCLTASVLHKMGVMDAKVNCAVLVEQPSSIRKNNEPQ
jgi:hypothetical protein